MKDCLAISIGYMSQFAAVRWARVDIDPIMYKAFEPLRLCDDPLVRIATREIAPNSEECQVVIKMRKDAAEYLSRQIADMILAEIVKHDTVNGYPLVHPNF